MFHEGKDLDKLFGLLGAPSGFPESFVGFAGGGRSLEGKGEGPARARPGGATGTPPNMLGALKSITGGYSYPGLQPGEIGYNDPGGD